MGRFLRRSEAEMENKEKRSEKEKLCKTDAQKKTM